MIKKISSLLLGSILMFGIYTILAIMLVPIPAKPDLIVDSQEFADAEAVYQFTKDKVVKVLHPLGGGCSGFRLDLGSGKKVLVTNSHCCAQAPGLLKISSVESKILEKPVKILGQVPESDTCVLEENDQSLPAFTVALDAPKPGQRLYVAGHPKLRPLTVVAGHHRVRELVEILAHDEKCEAPHMRKQQVPTLFGMVEECVATYDAYDNAITIRPGNSGSPLLNKRGQVLGIVFAGDDVSSSAIPNDLMLKAIHKVLSTAN